MKRTPIAIPPYPCLCHVCISKLREAQVKKASPPIAFLQQFYTAYIRSVDRMLEQDQRDSIIATVLSLEMQEKTHRLVAATGVDPILRQQDTRSGLEKTFRARQLKGDWYEVSLGGTKVPSVTDSPSAGSVTSVDM